MPPMTFSSMAPLTVADYLAIPENTDIRLELQDGGVVVKPRPTAQHQVSLIELLLQLHRCAPDLISVPSVDVDLQLVPPEQPGTVRAPDLVVVTRQTFDRVRDGTEPIRAQDLVLVGDVLGPGSHRTDTVIKRADYASADIGHYWLIDLDDGPGLTAHHLDGAPDYADAEPVRGVFATDVPFPARVDLVELVR